LKLRKRQFSPSQFGTISVSVRVCRTTTKAQNPDGVMSVTKTDVDAQRRPISSSTLQFIICEIRVAKFLGAVMRARRRAPAIDHTARNVRLAIDLPTSRSSSEIAEVSHRVVQFCSGLRMRDTSPNPTRNALKSPSQTQRCGPAKKQFLTCWDFFLSLRVELFIQCCL